MSILIIIIPVIVAIITQITKVIIDAASGNYRFSSFYNYGGMPSGHAAFMTSVVLVIFLTNGINSPVFALSVILAIIVIRDAISLRQHMSEHSKTLNKIIKDLPDDKEYKYPVLEERIGHSLTQVLAGIFTGLILTLILYYQIFLTK